MITGYGFSHRKFNFPCGDTHVQVTLDDDSVDSPIEIDFDYENDGEIIELLLLCDALHQMGMQVETLRMAYVPFSRQDRVVNRGEPLSIKVFANLINNLQIPNVYIMDPHSDVTTALIENVHVTDQSDVFGPLLYELYSCQQKDFVLVSPDAGASKKIYKLLDWVQPFAVFECAKTRDTRTGEITGVRVPDLGGTTDKDFIIVDDLCDGGQTFIKLAKQLRKQGVNRIILMVTHGFFTKGLKVFDGIIDEIYTRKGRVK